MHALQPSHTWRYELLTHAAHTLLYFHPSARGGFSWSRMPGTLPSEKWCRAPAAAWQGEGGTATPHPARAGEERRGLGRVSRASLLARVMAALWLLLFKKLAPASAKYLHFKLRREAAPHHAHRHDPRCDPPWRCPGTDTVKMDLNLLRPPTPSSSRRCWAH